MLLLTGCRCYILLTAFQKQTLLLPREMGAAGSTTVTTSCKVREGLQICVHRPHTCENTVLCLEWAIFLQSIIQVALLLRFYLFHGWRS